MDKDGNRWTPPTTAEETSNAEESAKEINLDSGDTLKMTEEKTAKGKFHINQIDDWAVGMSDIPGHLLSWRKFHQKDVAKYSKHLDKMNDLLIFISKLDIEEGKKFASEIAANESVNGMRGMEFTGINPTSMGGTFKKGQKAFLTTLDTMSNGSYWTSFGDFDPDWDDVLNDKDIKRFISKGQTRQKRSERNK